MIDATFVEKVSELAVGAYNVTGKVIEVGGRDYTTLPLAEVVPGKVPEPTALSFSTLTSLLDFAANGESRDRPVLGLHVVSPVRVDLLSQLVPADRHQQRFVYATAGVVPAMTNGFRVGSYYALEDLIISLQSLFVESTDRARVLALLGNLRMEAVRTQADDGVSQTVTARSGVVLSTSVVVPNPVVLIPYRTFIEVEQPSSIFILRLKGGGDEGAITAALFEADGGAWRLRAVEAIAKFLRDKTTLPVFA